MRDSLAAHGETVNIYYDHYQSAPMSASHLPRTCSLTPEVLIYRKLAVRDHHRDCRRQYLCVTLTVNCFDLNVRL